MFTRQRSFSTLGAALALALAPLSAGALGINVQTFPGTASGLGSAQAAYNTELGKFVTSTVEDFETGFSLGQISGSLTTAVGDFTTLGGTGSGTSAVGSNNLNTDADEGQNLAVRRDNDGQNDGGRFNTTAGFTDFTGAGTYLDSNDTTGIKWSIPGSVSGGLGMFDRILFNLVDVADQGKILTIDGKDQNGNSFFLSPTTIAAQSGSTINTVLISFDTLVSVATITLTKNGVNDGFSIDDATVGAIPLPAAAWLLLGVSGGLVVAKRRSARRAA